MAKEIIYRKLTELKKLPNNPRTIKKDDMERLKKSIKDNPDYFEARPIILSNRTGELVILAGNQRYEAAKYLKMEEVPTFLLEGLTEAREREIIIRDNVSNGDWDMDTLANEWDTQELTDWGLDLDWDEPEQEVVEDEAPEVSDEPADSVLGGAYQLGRHRLMCGDSTDAGSVAILMDGQKADLWLTDPPYNVDIGQGGGSIMSMRKQNHRTDGATIMNDKMDSEKFREFLFGAFSAAVENMREGAVFYVWHSDTEGLNFRKACKESGLQVRQCLIWAKDQLIMGRWDYQSKHEPCLYGWKGGAPHNWYSDRKQTTLLEFERPKRSEEHPTMKPVALFSYQIQNSSKKGDAVLDTFGGSGTTLIACEQLGRKCYMMELDPHYCDVIRKRYWRFVTGSEQGWQDGTKAV